MAKVRFIYHAKFLLTVLGLYVMDYMYDTFQAISGVDMGHNLFGALVVKLSVINNVVLGLFGMNCDGKRFNENHLHKDTSLVSNVCRHLKTYKIRLECQLGSDGCCTSLHRGHTQ